MENNKKTKEYIPFENISRPVPATKDLVNKHLKDPNHVITEEEIRSIEVGKYFAKRNPKSN